MGRAQLLLPLLIAAAVTGCGSGEARPAQADPAPVTDPASAEPVRYESREHGFSVVIPPGWHRAERPITVLTEPVERLVAATYAPREGDEDCGPLAFAGFDADEALVVVLERGRDPESDWRDFPERPARFRYEPGMTSEFSACLRTRRNIPLRDHWFRFTDAGRHFHVLVAIGDSADPGRAREAYRMLDSLRFDPAVQPDWRSAG